MDLKRVIKVIRQPSYLSWAAKVRMTKLSKVIRRRRSGERKYQRRAIMFHIGRSGSTLLADMLSQHDDIAWSGEIAKAIAGSRDSPAEKKFAAFEKMVDAALTRYSAYGVYGFEIKPFHVRALGVPMDRFIEWARARGFEKYVVLERKNYLRKILSSVSANKTGTWHAPSGVQSNVQKIHLSIQAVKIDQKRSSLIELLDEYSEEFENIRSALANSERLELSYEADIQNDPLVAARRCYKFFGVRLIDPATRYGRTNPYCVAELLDNPEEIKEALRSSKYEWMLDG